MVKQYFLSPLLLLSALLGTTAWMRAQNNDPKITVFHVNVDMVQLNVAVTDRKGHYITGLSPQDFAVYEDGIPQRIATFGEENQAPRKLENFRLSRGNPGKIASLYAKVPRQLVGASVFILFDTSNYMYKGFVFAQDAISEFVRSLDSSDRLAFYSYSRDFSRICQLTSNRFTVLHGVRRTVAGDDAALYDALLLTLKDAAKFTGTRAVVVFSNGPDNSSMVSPEDVRELAQSEGVPIYMVSTQEAQLDPLSSSVFKRMSATTGGKAYFAKNWKEQEKAFTSIRDDLAHLYTLAYYPRPNPNRGWRKITVKLLGKNLRKYHVRTRSGYRPKLVRAAAERPSVPTS